MPPSGYSVNQASLLADFLTSCFASLEEEAKSFGETIPQALSREVASIRRTLREQSLGDAERATLALTLAFYERLSDSNASKPRDAVQQAVELYTKAVLAIHVPASGPRSAQANSR